MNWRLHLASHALRNIAILPGDPAQVAVSDIRRRIQFYDLDSGGHYGDLEINLDLLDMDAGEERRAELSNLHAPNGKILPFVEFSGSHLYNSSDGDLHLIHDLSGGITLEVEDQIIPLETGRNSTVRLVALERELGTVAALTEDNHIHIFQQQTRVNTFPLETEQPQHLFLTDGGTHLLLIQPGCIRMLDTTGRSLRSQEVYYTIGLAALSPNGNWLVIGDADYQVIRLYNSDLIPIRQQHAIDLLENARQLQLFATLPGETAPLSALAIDNRGVLAFAVAGTLCVTQANRLSPLPQPRPLF